MTPEGKSTHVDSVVSSLGNHPDAERYRAAIEFLQMHLMIKRDIPNGKDFLFSGPEKQVLEALKVLTAVEHRSSPFLQFDYARINGYYLLRVIGGAEHQDAIAGYFD